MYSHVPARALHFFITEMPSTERKRDRENAKKTSYSCLARGHGEGVGGGGKGQEDERERKGTAEGHPRFISHAVYYGHQGCHFFLALYLLHDYALRCSTEAPARSPNRCASIKARGGAPAAEGYADTRAAVQGEKFQNERTTKSVGSGLFTGERKTMTTSKKSSWFRCLCVCVCGRIYIYIYIGSRVHGH